MWQIDDNKKIDYFSWSPKGVALRKEKERRGMKQYLHILMQLMDMMLCNINTRCKVLLNTKIEKYDLPNKCIYLNGEKLSFDVIVNTISPDIVMNLTYEVTLHWKRIS